MSVILIRKAVIRVTWFLMVSLLLAQTSCRVGYSFTGASISPDVKTVSIQYFPNNASLVMPTLSRTFTDGLRDYFTSQTNLILVDRNGDLNIEGAITAYAVTPVAIQGNETAAMNRLTIAVTVKFTNKKNEKQNFENKTFSRYQDYSSSQDLAAVQGTLISQIDDQLIQDIFNQAVANW
ncbi:MAG: LptE family protein [Bacteroidetes bacterium]|nr:LptE family protein [Bacteroidota bacterium]